MVSEHHVTAHAEHAGAFGSGGFGAFAEAIARFFGTPRYLAAQTALVALWIAANGWALLHFDPYPFILLNLAFSLQAAYAAPLILLAQTRQAARDKAFSEADSRHREQLTQQQLQLLLENTRLTEEVHRLTAEVHALVERIPLPSAAS
ncbi:MAG TPA: DUF1003 domain-containing protein [Dehalococcoidia bacterium]|nr:DUF1003 domain-containing protein [Dehalococcoidia bacterium]